MVWFLYDNGLRHEMVKFKRVVEILIWPNLSLFGKEFM